MGPQFNLRRVHLAIPLGPPLEAPLSSWLEFYVAPTKVPLGLRWISLPRTPVFPLGHIEDPASTPSRSRWNLGWLTSGIPTGAATGAPTGTPLAPPWGSHGNSKGTSNGKAVESPREF